MAESQSWNSVSHMTALPVKRSLRESSPRISLLTKPAGYAGTCRIREQEIQLAGLPKQLLHRKVRHTRYLATTECENRD